MPICLIKIETVLTDAPLLGFHELSDFEQIEIDLNGASGCVYFRYDDSIYNLSDFVVWEGEKPVYAENWGALGYSTQSAWSALYIKFSDCGGCVTVGYAHW